MPIQYKRLQKIADHLRNGKLLHKKFNFRFLNTNDDEWDLILDDDQDCGTMGCALGELPAVFPRHFQFSQGNYGKGSPELKGSSTSQSTATQVVKFLGIDEESYHHLFIPTGRNYPGKQQPKKFGGRKLGVGATKEQVAEQIEAFIKTKKRK